MTRTLVGTPDPEPKPAEWTLTDEDTRHLTEHLTRWMDGRTHATT